MHGLPYEVLGPEELARRFPVYRLPEGNFALYQPQGGFLTAEQCVVAHIEAALASGADVRGFEGLTVWEARSYGVHVQTPRVRYAAESLVITTGLWIMHALPFLRDIWTPERQVVGWFQPLNAQIFQPSRMPVFNLETPLGRFYGLPIFQVPGFKVGKYYHREEHGHPDTLDRSLALEDEATLREFVERHFPDGAGSIMNMKVCILTNTPDGHFVIQRHPEYQQVIFASPCSGHGFKFASVLGEILADLAMGINGKRLQLDYFSLQHFQYKQN